MIGSEKKNHELHFSSYPAPLELTTAYIKQHSTVVRLKGHRTASLALDILISILKRLSWRAAYRAGKAVGLLLYVLRIRRKIAMINLGIVYGATKSPAEKEKIYKASLVNFGRLVVNYLRIPFFGESFWRNHCEWKNEEILKNAMNQQKGAILIAGHIGMMDLAGGKLGMSGYPTFLVGKSIKHPVINHFVHRVRNLINLGTIKHKESIRRILKGLRRGEAIVMAVDQNMKKKQGIFIDWMGWAAASVRAPAIVVKLTGVPVVAGYMFQKSEDRFELVVTEEVAWEPLPDDPEKELVVNTQKQADAIQKIIYDHPELWFWIHRRWKRQPEGIPSPYAHLKPRKKKKRSKKKHENMKFFNHKDTKGKTKK